jgi:TolB-like protein/DNA-binding winged helix-turn-helix (wHTH) protein
MDVPASPELLAFGPFRFDRHRRALFRCTEDGQSDLVSIGGRALEVLAALIERPGSVVSKDEITAAVWPNTIVEDANLTVQISALSRALDPGRNGESCIQTVPGRGYRFLLPVMRGEQASAVALPPPSGGGAAATISRRPWPGRRLFAALGGIAAALLIVALAWDHGRFWQQSSLPRLSLVVLPFENLSSDSGDDYLAAGVTDGLTAALSHIPGAFVIARATANAYRGKAEDIRQVGRDLSVRYVVRGSIQRLGQVLKVNAELGSTETGAELWSDTFDQKVSDLAAGQEQIVVRMRAALNISLTDIEAARSLRERPTSPDAFDLILRARAIFLLPQTKETNVRQFELYEQALQRDPNSVLALTGAVDTVLSIDFNSDAPGGGAYQEAMDRAEHYLDRAQKLEPNAESVLVAQSEVLDMQEGGLDYHHVYGELKTVGQKLIDLYPNNAIGYFRLGVLGRNQGRYEEAAGYFAQFIRLSPRSPAIKNLYWNMAYCTTWAGHDREGLEWIDRSTGAAGTLPPYRAKYLNILRTVAYVRTGDLETAKRLAKELNDHYPFETWRAHSPDDPESETVRQQTRSFMEALKAAGLRDHVDPDADFGVAPEDALHLEVGGETPTTAPGVTTVGTEQLEGMLRDKKPLVIDTMTLTWYRSVPGAIGLEFKGNTHGTFTDEVQKRLEQKLHELTGGDGAKPIVAMGWSAATFDGYNLALRVRHAGYTNVYWYRGGREAWEVAGKPEAEARPADW